MRCAMAVASVGSSSTTKGGKWTEVLTTDDEIYGGSGIHNGTVEAIEGEYHSRDWSAKITVPALGAVFLKPEL